MSLVRPVACAALVVFLGVLGACAVRHECTGYRDWEVQASVTSNGAPQTGLDVKVWIVDVDVPGTARVPIEMEPVTTDVQGEAIWTYNAVGEPYVCGYEVRDLAGTLLVRNEPYITNQVGIQARVEIELP